MPYTFNPFTGSFDNTPSVAAAEGAYLPLSGGTITGNLSVEGNFEVGSSEESITMFISGSRVGINTETPNQELTVVGDISATGVIYASGGNSNIWNESYSLIQSNSASWVSDSTVDAEVRALTSTWDSTYTTVQNNSADWETAYEIGTAYSLASSTFLTFETDSQTLSFNEGTKDLSISGGNTVSLSALIDDTGIDASVRALTANWESTYNTVSSLSSSWGAFIGGAYLPLSGGTITGNLQVSGTTTLSGTTEIGPGQFPTLYVESSSVGINTTTPNKELTVVGNISATSIIYADGGNSVIWNEAYTTVLSNSATWSLSGTAEVLLAEVKNAETIQLNRGDVVYTYGATGNTMSVKLASNVGELSSSKTIGVVNGVIAANGGTGYITTVGRMDQLNLGSFLEGDSLWLGSTPGSFTNIKPTAPAHSVYLGVIERANNGNGIAYIKVQNGYELGELHNVKLTNSQPGDALVKNGSNDLWVNVPLSSTQWNSVYTNVNTNSATYIKANVADTTPVYFIRAITQAEYDAIVIKNPNTLYFITT